MWKTLSQKKLSTKLGNVDYFSYLYRAVGAGAVLNLAAHNSLVLNELPELYNHIHYLKIYNPLRYNELCLLG